MTLRNTSCKFIYTIFTYTCIRYIKVYKDSSTQTQKENMNITDLINKLQSLLKEHGDVPVFYQDNTEADTPEFYVPELKFYEDKVGDYVLIS